MAISTVKSIRTLKITTSHEQFGRCELRSSPSELQSWQAAADGRAHRALHSRSSPSAVSGHWRAAWQPRQRARHSRHQSPQRQASRTLHSHAIPTTSEFEPGPSQRRTKPALLKFYLSSPPAHMPYHRIEGISLLKLTDLCTYARKKKDWSFLIHALMEDYAHLNPLEVLQNVHFLARTLAHCMTYVNYDELEYGEWLPPLFDQLKRNFNLPIRDDCWTYYLPEDEGMIDVFVALWLSRVLHRHCLSPILRLERNEWITRREELQRSPLRAPPLGK